jgi:hypothetical protein
MTITEKDFRDFVQRRMADAVTAPDRFRDRFQEIMDFAVANESSMDDGANAYCDNLIDAFATMFEVGLAGMADGPDKRRLLRLVALTKRKHHQAQNFLVGLGRPLPTPFPVAEAAKPIFLDSLQSILDLLFDATREHQKNAGEFASLSMLYWTVDELTTAFYLSERKYTTQAYSHLRTVHDLLDKAELFSHDPQLADVWGGADKKKILKELAPGAVRKKLGKPRFDAVYDFFTERGMHGTFSAVQKRVIRRGKSQNTTRIAMWIGGVAFDEEVDIAVSSCVLSALLTLIKVADVYRARLNAEEVQATVQARADAAVEFVRMHLVKPLQNSGEAVSSITELLIQLAAARSETK